MKRPLSILFLMLALCATAAAQDTQDRSAVKCAADSPERRGEEGCTILASRPLSGALPGAVYWHIDRFDSLDDAKKAAGPNGVATQAHGSVWLMTVEGKTRKHHGGAHVALIGPLILPTAESYTMRVQSSLLKQGASTPIHTHAGPEVFYIVSGEQCLETEKAAHRLKAGKFFVLPTDQVHRGRVQSANMRGALALVLHDSKRPASYDLKESDSPPLMSCGTRDAAAVDVPATEYIARTVSVLDSEHAKFLRCMQRDDLPLRKRLKREGVLSEQSVFETTETTVNTPETPFWNFLILTGVDSSVRSKDFFRAEEKLYKKGRRTNCFEAPGTETRRVEILRTTPNSFYPRPSSESRSAEFSVRYIVEYIAVQDTQTALDEYREAMRTKLGPALGLLITEGRMLNFIALETVSIRYSQSGLPEWNQIHIRGGNFPEKGAVRPAMDRVLKSMDPNSGGAAAVYGRLDVIRTKPREDVARQLEELAIR